MRVTLTIHENPDSQHAVTERYVAEQNGGKFTLGLVFQVCQAAFAARQHEFAMAKALFDAMAPAIDVFRRAFLGKVETETSEHKDDEKAREGTSR